MVEASFLFFKLLLGLDDNTELRAPFISALRWAYFKGSSEQERDTERGASSKLLVIRLVLGLWVDVLCSLPCRSLLAEQAEKSRPVPASPASPFSERLLFSGPHLQDATELPALKPLESCTLEALPTPPASPSFPPPPSPSELCENLFPASAPCQVPLRYKLLFVILLLYCWVQCQKMCDMFTFRSEGIGPLVAQVPLSQLHEN